MLISLEWSLFRVAAPLFTSLAMHQINSNEPRIRRVFDVHDVWLWLSFWNCMHLILPHAFLAIFSDIKLLANFLEIKINRLDPCPWQSTALWLLLVLGLRFVDQACKFICNNSFCRVVSFHLDFISCYDKRCVMMLFWMHTIMTTAVVTERRGIGLTDHQLQCVCITSDNLRVPLSHAALHALQFLARCI